VGFKRGRTSHFACMADVVSGFPEGLATDHESPDFLVVSGGCIAEVVLIAEDLRGRRGAPEIGLCGTRQHQRMALSCQ